MSLRSRLRTFWIRQRRSWIELIGAEPRTIDIGPSAALASHPSTACICAGVPVDHNTAAQAVDHHPDCPWLMAMCKDCSGEGCCQRCRGDGVDPYPDTPPVGAVGDLEASP